MLGLFGESPSAAASALATFTHTSFSALRHLVLYAPTDRDFLKLLPLLPSLTTLSLEYVDPYAMEDVFTAVASDAHPTLAVLEFGHLAVDEEDADEDDFVGVLIQHLAVHEEDFYGRPPPGLSLALSTPV